MSTVLELASLQGSVIRMRAEVDRFGRFSNQNGMNRTVCFKNLRCEKTDQPIRPDHIWLLERQEIAQLNLQPGDLVAFTAKIQRQHKGCANGLNDDLNIFSSPAEPLSSSPNVSPLRTTYGPGRQIRDLTILKRRKVVPFPPQMLDSLQAQLDIAEQEKQNLILSVQQLDHRNAELRSLLRREQQQSSNIQRELQQQQGVGVELKTQLEQQCLSLQAQTGQLTATVAQLEQQLQTTLPKQKAGLLLGGSVLISLVLGVGLGVSVSRPAIR